MRAHDPGPIACLLDHVLEEHCEPLVELRGDLRTRESLLSLVVDCNIPFVVKFRELFYKYSTC